MGTPNAEALAAAYLEYASLGLARSALHLGPFEQPAEERKKAHLEQRGQKALKGLLE
jgi:hypothetical protein